MSEIPMSKIDVDFTETANLAITEQWDYYNDLGRSDVADLWEAAVATAVNSLLKSPERGAHCRLKKAVFRELRWTPVHEFPLRVFYLFDRDAHILTVVHVLHYKRKIDDLLEAALREL